MSQKSLAAISIIIPFFNAKKYIYKCIKSLENQNIKEKIELIFIDDCSSDGTKNLIINSKLKNYKLITFKKNFGPSKARNEGLKISKGKYIFFLDADDTINKNALSQMYKVAIKNNYDIVFSDKKRIGNNINLRKNIFAYNQNKIFTSNQITEEIIKRITDPEYTVGVAGCHGKLIKKSIIKKNKISFENKLRFFEDETFIIDILGVVKKMKYLKKQLYVYNLNPKSGTGRSDAFNKGISIKNFKIMRDHIKKSLRNRNCNKKKITRYSDQALIYYLIYTLISYSLCIFRGKINYIEGISKRKKIINEIIKDNEIFNAAKNYTISKKESHEIPKAIILRSKKLLEMSCNMRTKMLLKKEKKIYSKIKN